MAALKRMMWRIACGKALLLIIWLIIACRAEDNAQTTAAPIIEPDGPQQIRLSLTHNPATEIMITWLSPNSHGFVEYYPYASGAEIIGMLLLFIFCCWHVVVSIFNLFLLCLLRRLILHLVKFCFSVTSLKNSKYCLRYIIFIFYSYIFDLVQSTHQRNAWASMWSLYSFFVCNIGSRSIMKQASMSELPADDSWKLMVHSVILRPLLPGTVYKYRVANMKGILEWGYYSCLMNVHYFLFIIIFCFR